MRTATFFIILSILLFSISKAGSQDAVFTQWENLSIYTNPALTGDFKGSFRFRTKYRDQWRSFLKNNAFKTGIASIEYKFDKEKLRKFNIGFHTLLDRAGGSKFTTNSYNLSASVIQNLGDPEIAHHKIGIGFNFGLASISSELLNQMGQGGNPADSILKINYPDISAGLNWQYLSNSNFSFHLGSALYHLNQPNLSFTKGGNAKAYLRFNLHGNVEIPIADKMSFVPSFLFYKQGPSAQLLFGMYSKWYLNSTYSNNFQFGVLAKTNNSFDGNTIINVFVISTRLEVNSFLVGFSVDRFKVVKSNAYELSIGYTLGRRKNVKN